MVSDEEKNEKAFSFSFFLSQHIFSPYIQVYNYKHMRDYNHLFK